MKWSAMIFRFISISLARSPLSSMPFDCEFCSYVSEVLSLNLYCSTSQRFDDDEDLARSEMRFLPFLRFPKVKRQARALWLPLMKKMQPPDIKAWVFGEISQTSNENSEWPTVRISNDFFEVWRMFLDFRNIQPENSKNGNVLKRLLNCWWDSSCWKNQHILGSLRAAAPQGA